MPASSVLQWLTLGASFGRALTDPLDYTPAGARVEGRVGLVSPARGVGGELAVGLYGGHLRTYPFPFAASELRAALTYDLTPGGRVAVPLRFGVGVRRLSIDETVTVGGYPVEERMGLWPETVDLGPFLGSGLRIGLAGPVYLRVDGELATHIGDRPQHLPPHAFWELKLTAGFEVRGPYGAEAARTRTAVAAQMQPQDPDADGDGVAGSQDRCPDSPEDRDGFADSDGCADPNDDHDRYPDVLDRCPREAETENGWADGDGCMDQPPPALRMLENAEPDLIAPGGVLTPAAEARLAAIAAVLEAEPQARVLLIVHPGLADTGYVTAATQEAATTTARALSAWTAAHGLGERVAFWWTNADTPLGRLTLASRSPLPGTWVELALFDLVDATGGPVPMGGVIPEP